MHSTERIERAKRSLPLASPFPHPTIASASLASDLRTLTGTGVGSQLNEEKRLIYRLYRV